MAVRNVLVIEKYPVEVFVEQVDFTPVLNVGESLSTADVVAMNARTGGDTTADMISSISIEAGNLVQFTLSGGALDSRYIVEASVVLNNGQELAERIRVNVPGLLEP